MWRRLRVLYIKMEQADIKMKFREALNNEKGIKDGIEDWRQREINWMSELVPEYNAKIYADEEIRKRLSGTKY